MDIPATLLLKGKNMEVIINDSEIDDRIPDLRPAEKHFKSWLVYLDGKLFDTVNYSSDMNIKQVKRTLIMVDNYPHEIEVIEE